MVVKCGDAVAVVGKMKNTGTVYILREQEGEDVWKVESLLITGNILSCSQQMVSLPFNRLEDEASPRPASHTGNITSPIASVQSDNNSDDDDMSTLQSDPPGDSSPQTDSLQSDIQSPPYPSRSFSSYVPTSPYGYEPSPNDSLASYRFSPTSPERYRD